MSIMDAINTQQIHDHAASACLACTTSPRPAGYVVRTQSMKIMPRRRFRVRWADVATALLVCLCSMTMVTIFLLVADSNAADREAASHSVPACTDEIADAGGICIGEPE